MITEGKVQVNGRRITELGVKIDPQKDKVKVNGQLLAQEKPVYYLLNKPKGVITSVSDPQGRETVIDYIKNESKTHLSCGPSRLIYRRFITTY